MHERVAEIRRVATNIVTWIKINSIMCFNLTERLKAATSRNAIYHDI